MMDEALQTVIAKIPQQAQRQYSTDEQLRILSVAAARLGLNDAADAISSMLMTYPSRFSR